MEKKKSAVKFAIGIVIIGIVIAAIVGLDKQAQERAIDAFPTVKVSNIAKRYGINDFEYYAVKNDSGNYYVKIKSNDFGNLSDEKKLKLLDELDRKNYYYSFRGILSGGDEYTLDWNKDELEKNDITVYSLPKPESSYSGSSYGGSSKKSCSSCGGSGKKVVAFYEYGDWGDVSYSTYDCPNC